MKRKFDLIMIGLMLLSLAACQTTPVPSSTPTPASASGTVAEFYKEEAGRWLSIALPEGWVARQGGDDAHAPIVVTDNWEKYQNKDLDKEALGIIVSPLTDKGTPKQILDTVVGRLTTMLTERQGDVTSSQQGNQKIAFAEYGGKSVADGTPLKYLLAVVATDQRSVFAFTSVLPEQVEHVRPKFQEIVRGITLH